MIEIFKTNVGQTARANELIGLLRQRIPDAEVNFDLEDCDRILRIKGTHFCTDEVISFLAGEHVECSVLC